MDFESLAREIFKLDSNVRYVGLLDEKQDSLLLSEMREGVVSVTEDQTDRQLMSTFPPVILRAVERLEPHIGQLNGIVVRYEKVVLVFYRLGQYMVILSFEPTVHTPFLEHVVEMMERFNEELRQ